MQKDKSVSVHMKNLQYLATEIFKVKNSLSPIIMHEVFKVRENESCNLRKGIRISSRNIHTAHFGTDTISSSGRNLLKLKPDKIKHASILSAFKAKDKSWTISNTHVDNEKYLLNILALLKVVRVSNVIHTKAIAFLLKKEIEF